MVIKLMALWRQPSVFADSPALESLSGGTVDRMDALSDLETRVLGVLEQRPGLEIEQVASAARLPIRAATQAVDGLIQKELLLEDQGRYGRTFQLNRPNVRALLVA